MSALGHNRSNQRLLRERHDARPAIAVEIRSADIDASGARLHAQVEVKTFEPYPTLRALHP